MEQLMIFLHYKVKPNMANSYLINKEKHSRMDKQLKPSRDTDASAILGKLSKNIYIHCDLKRSFKG